MDYKDSNNNSAKLMWQSADTWKGVRHCAFGAMTGCGVGDQTIEERIQKETNKLIREFCKREEDGCPFYPMEILHKGVTNILSSIIFGCRYKYKSTQFQKFICMIRELSDTNVLDSTTASHFLYLASLPLPKPKKAVKNMNELICHVVEEVAKHKENFDCNHMRDFVDLYLKEVNSAGFLKKEEVCIPLGIPHSTRQDVGLSGYSIQANTIVICNLQAIHLNDGYWNSPCEFDPERFLDDDGDCGKTKLTEKDKFIPFGIGPRSCLGKELAWNILFLVFTGLMQRFNFQSAANKDVESQHYNRSDEERVTRGGERHATDDYRHLREDDNAAAAAGGGGGGEGKHRCRHQASAEEQEELRFLTRAQGLEGAASQQKIFVNQDDMQPIIHRSTDKNDDTRDQRHGLQSPSELSAKSAARGSDRGAFPLQSVRRLDVEADHRRESKRPIQENRGAHNDKSSLTSSVITASSDYDGSSSFNDEGEDEDEMGRSDISLESRRYRGLVDVISYMILQRQQMNVQRSDQLTNNSNNDYVKKTEAVKYRSERPSESDPSSSSSVEEENEEEEEEESSEPSSGEFGPRLEVPGASPANIREPKFLSAVQSTSPSAKNESETTSSAPSSSSLKNESETTSSAPSSSSSLKKESETMSSVPSSSSIKKESETMSSVPSSSPPMKTRSESTSSAPSSSSPMKKESERMSSAPSSSSSIRNESERLSSVPNSSSSIKKGSSVPNPSSSKRKKSERMPLAPSSSSSVRKESEPKLEVVYNSWEAKPSVGKDALSGRGVVAATSSHSILSTMEEGGLDGTTEHATMSAEAEATLKSFATEVVQSLYAAIRFKLKSLVDDIKDETKKQEILQRGDIELRSQILPTIIEHIVWIIKEEFRGQDEAKWKEAMMQDPGQYLDTIVTNAVMKTHADHRM